MGPAVGQGFGADSGGLPGCWLCLVEAGLHTPQGGCFPPALSGLTHFWVTSNGQVSVHHCLGPSANSAAGTGANPGCALGSCRAGCRSTSMLPWGGGTCSQLPRVPGLSSSPSILALCEGPVPTLLAWQPAQTCQTSGPLYQPLLGAPCGSFLLWVGSLGPGVDPSQAPGGGGPRRAEQTRAVTGTKCSLFPALF